MKLCTVVYLAVLLPCVLVVNKARGFFEMCWQMTVILLIVNLIDRLLIDEFWVGHTKAWIIPGTEDMMPYINSRDGGQFARIGLAARRLMTPFLYHAIKSLYLSKGRTLKKIMWCYDESIKLYFIAAGICAVSLPTALRTSHSRRCPPSSSAGRSLSSETRRSISSTVQMS